MEQTPQKPKRGGYRAGGGRPRGERSLHLCIRISPEALHKLEQLTQNKSEFIDRLILDYEP